MYDELPGFHWVNYDAKITSIKYPWTAKYLPYPTPQKDSVYRKTKLDLRILFFRFYEIINFSVTTESPAVDHSEVYSFQDFLLPQTLSSTYWCIIEVKFGPFIVAGCFHRTIAFISKPFNTLFSIIKGQSQNKLNYQDRRKAIEFWLFLKGI